MVSASPVWTAEMVRALPDDGNRYEVIGGELLVSPAPSCAHQIAVVQLLGRLLKYLDVNPVGWVLCSPADISFGSDTLVQPDVFVVPRVGKRPRSWEEIKELLLVVEVLSPSSARTDRLRKRKFYLAQPAVEYWVVDLDARLLERWRHGDSRPEILSESVNWHPAQAGEPLVLNMAQYFSEVLDD